MKNISVAVVGLLIGIIVGFAIINYQNNAPKHIKAHQQQVIGFLPYWLLDRAQKDYSDSITTLTYFALNVDGSGHIVKLANEQQDDPGWSALHSGKLNPFLKNAKESHIKLSLLISSGDSNAIQSLVSKPTQNADTLVAEVKPIMKQYGFSDLNLDIEYTAASSTSLQTHFTQFVQAVKQQLVKQNLGTLTIEISPNDIIKTSLINTQSVTPFADNMILMAYDYHSPTSFVTGPVAPLNGAGIDSEYDVTTAVSKALQTIPSEKLILGMPLYGYEWETLNTAVRSAVIQGTGLLASNDGATAFLSNCATCSAFFDTQAQEEYAVYKDTGTGTYHQLYFPTQNSVKAKIDLAGKEHLGGVGLWALGYEGGSMLSPLTAYLGN